MKFGSNLKCLRKKTGLNQADLAEIIGKKKSAISYYESGTGFPDLSIAKQISDYFGISLDDLIQKDLSQKDIKGRNEEDLDLGQDAYTETTNELRVELVNAQRRIINFMDNEKKYEEARQVSQGVINDLSSQVRLLQEKSNNLEKEIRELTERLKKINAG